MRRGRVGYGAGTVRAAIAVAACCLLANCTSSPKFMSKFDPRLGVSSSPRVVGPGEPVPKGGGRYTVGVPYQVGGRTYVPEDNPRYRAEGMASWYGDDFHGRLTANGEVYDMHGISAAHPTLPMPSYVRVTNLGNSRSLIVRVNDRGPYHSDRVIDLSVKAARLLDFHGDGLARVRVEYVSPAPLEGSDDSVLLATLRNGSPAPSPSPILLASSKPFLPQLGSRNAPRGPVPMPPDRPYDLGTAQASTEARTATEVSGAARPRKVQTAFDTRFAADRMPPMVADVPKTPAPVAAFAPPRADAGPSIMTGRGLY
jgi:rare lipoprotein A